ncbi:MAG: septal ring lytic transglycosylase RlpA family lipoprotein [Candidatus Dadabacteria bacterium]
MSRERIGLFLLLTVLFFSSCASVSKRGIGMRPTENNSQIGVASWYGVDEDGGKTASGERFSMHSYTAAHQTLPIGTVVRVVNLENGRDVIVKINDRGPFKKGRIIDLSYAAAKSIGMLGKGTAKVRVEVISVPGRSADYFDAKYTVQVGSFKDKRSALDLKEHLDSSLSDVRIEPIDLDGDIYYRIRIGRFSQRDEAEELATRLRRSGYTGSVIQE